MLVEVEICAQVKAHCLALLILTMATLTLKKLRNTHRAQQYALYGLLRITQTMSA